MTREEITLKILEVFRREFEMENPDLDGDLRETGEFDSIDAIELLLEIERFLQTELTHEEKQQAMEIRTIRQVTLGWWRPSAFAVRQGRLWTSLWMRAVKPVMKYFVDRRIERTGWQGRYEGYLRRLEAMNRFAELDGFRGKDSPENRT